ncbi:hypothetical protein MNBD_ALPHA02-1883 [hydrothermal vent metagenome]|uniref:Uncharacterized protein n=1 Tax=hydrothermal vent metagenome TaxID=652676 RepID=A0A3B0RGS7_9ZZZZ
MTKLVFISRDPGGTNQLVALRQILLGPDSDVRTALFRNLELSAKPDITIIAKDYARKIWQQNDITAQEWPEADIPAFLNALNADQIITSTCHVDDRTEQAVWRAARTLGIKTTAFLDSIHNIELRFRDDEGAIILPDRLSLIDEQTAGAARSLGIEDIFVSGDLYLNHARHKVHNRLDWGAEAGACVILFASDYIREMQALGVQFDITEFDCLDQLLDLMMSGEITRHMPDAHPPYHLVIRPHPKDTPGKYDTYVGRAYENLTIVIEDRGSGTDAVRASDMVAGHGSSLMTEARALSVPVLELEPIVRCRKDPEKTPS